MGVLGCLGGPTLRGSSPVKGEGPSCSRRLEVDPRVATEETLGGGWLLSNITTEDVVTVN